MRIQTIILCCAIGAASPALSLGEPGKSKASYSVAIKGVHAGQMDLAANVSGRQYAVAANVKSTGLVGLFAKFRFKANTQGRTLNSGAYRPVKYTENSDNGGDKTQQTITYKNGIPRSTRPAVAGGLTASSQKNTADPLTAIFEAFRDQSRDSLCKSDLVIFDGKRRTQLKLQKAQITDTTAVCVGSYNRLAGFTAAKLEDGKAFPIQIEYIRRDGRFRVQKMTVQSVRGRAVFSRR